MQKKFKLLATSSSGLESLVARELRNLEIENVSIDDRSRVFFEGNLATIAKANLWLRTADRVKIVVGEFKARTFDELFENVYALPWAELIPFGSQFPVSKAKAVKSTLHNEPSIQSITKKSDCQKNYRRLIIVLKVFQFLKMELNFQLRLLYTKIWQLY